LGGLVAVDVAATVAITVSIVAGLTATAATSIVCSGAHFVNYRRWGRLTGFFWLCFRFCIRFELGLAEVAGAAARCPQRLWGIGGVHVASFCLQIKYHRLHPLQLSDGTLTWLLGLCVESRVYSGPDTKPC
jgi:hypothetical protein